MLAIILLQVRYQRSQFAIPIIHIQSSAVFKMQKLHNFLEFIFSHGSFYQIVSSSSSFFIARFSVRVAGAVAQD